jgi:single-stranded DNA-binding protein
MAFLNSVALIGNGYDIKSKLTTTGKSFVSFNLMVVDKYNNEERKNYFHVNCYSGLADNVEKYWEEGKLFYISGSIRNYKDSQGVWKYSIVADEIKFL